MPIFKVIPGYQKYHDINSYRDVITYCLQHTKTPNSLIGGIAEDVETAILLMQLHTESYYKESGANLRHMVLNFSKDEDIDFIQAYYIAQAIANYYSQQYQILFVIHEDHACPHIHFIMNTVDYSGKKYDGTKKDYYSFQAHMRHILKRYNLSLKICKYEALG